MEIIKKCARCGADKPVGSFYAQKQRTDGKHPWCKECCWEWKRDHREQINARDRERRATDSDYRERVKLIHRQWGRRHAAHKQEYERRRRTACPEEYQSRNMRYADLHPEMMRDLAAVRQRVYYAIKTGKLHRPDTCERCGRQGGLQAAHHDYSRPLDVAWLCRSCHTQWDYWEPKYAGKREEGAYGRHH